MEDRQLTLSKAVAKDSLLKIYRETTTETIVSWNDASVLRAKDMSIQEVQLLHLAEETADKVFDSGMSTAPTNTNVWDGQYKRITDLLDPQEDGDAVTLRYINDKQHGLITALKNEGATQDEKVKATGDTYVATMTNLKDTTTTQANNASNSATSAATSASTASTQATNAGKSASNASTKATEASNSATLAKAWAMSDSSPDGVSGNKSSKTWANEAKASASNAATSASTATAKATEATTQATNAASSASAAAKSAQDAAKFDPSSYYTKAQTYTKTEVDKVVADKIATDGMPTGTVLSFAGNTIPKNYLLCDGRAVSRSTYADLFKVIGTTYGVGNGYSTFNLPNLVDKFVEGGSTSGRNKQAGLPNITGMLGDSYGASGLFWIVNGAFYGDNTNIAGRRDGGTIEEQNSFTGGDVYFDASHSNSIYGKSTTVQPPAIVMRYIIKI